MINNNNTQKKIWFYDIEQLKNFHSCYFVSLDEKETKFFVISHLQNDIWDYIDFLNNKVLGLIGFNNLNYDYPMIYYIMNDLQAYTEKFSEPDKINKKLYLKSQKIITSNFSAIAPWNVQIPQLDLFKIHHFDNKAKRTSLKQIQYVLQWDNVAEMPIHHTEKIQTKEQLDIVKKYNINDVKSTIDFYYKSEGAISVRRAMSKKFGIDMMNFNDPKIGQEIFIKIIADKLGYDIKYLKSARTHRDNLPLKDCVLPYVKFKSVQFNLIKKWIERQVISTTNGVFTKLSVNSVPELLKYMNTKKEKGKIKNLNIIYKGVQFNFGVGGIHGSVPAGIYSPDEDEEIIDIDVASYYPNLAIQNRFYPKHLSEEFCDIYKEIYLTRKVLKAKGKKGDYMAKLEQGILKLVLNGVYGKSGDVNSPFYDIKFMLQITINGQLLLCMLAEELLEIDKLKLLQINTDGLSFVIKKKNKDNMRDICKAWEKLTNLELEETYYKNMIIGDVNNYIAIKNKSEKELTPAFEEASWYDNNYTKHKLKGRFQVVLEQNGNIAYNKNWSNIISRKAIHDYFVYNIPVEKTISECNNILDFCYMYKGIDNWEAKKILPDRTYVKLGHMLRYYVSVKGEKFIKYNTEDHRIEELQAGRFCVEYNKHKPADIDSYKIDYNFYISKTKREINRIKNYNLMLNLK